MAWDNLYAHAQEWTLLLWTCLLTVSGLFFFFLTPAVRSIASLRSRQAAWGMFVSLERSLTQLGTIKAICWESRLYADTHTHTNTHTCSDTNFSPSLSGHLFGPQQGSVCKCCGESSPRQDRSLWALPLFFTPTNSDDHRVKQLMMHSDSHITSLEPIKNVSWNKRIQIGCLKPSGQMLLKVSQSRLGAKGNQTFSVASPNWNNLSLIKFCFCF